MHSHRPSLHYLSIIIFPIDLCAFFPSNKLQFRTGPLTHTFIFFNFSLISRLALQGINDGVKLAKNECAQEVLAVALPQSNSILVSKRAADRWSL